MSKKLNAALDESKIYALTLFRKKKIKLPRNIKWSISHDKRGRATAQPMEDDTWSYGITLPKGALRRKDYKKYYAIHELSHVAAHHAYGPIGINHGESFYKVFLKACPVEWLKWELDYKISAVKHVKKFYCL